MTKVIDTVGLREAVQQRGPAIGSPQRTSPYKTS
jgi:hypothetical protein